MNKLVFISNWFWKWYSTEGCNREILANDSRNENVSVVFFLSKLYATPYVVYKCNYKLRSPSGQNHVQIKKKMYALFD